MSFAQYKSLLKDEDGAFKVDWNMMSTNLVGLVIVLIASIQARISEPATEVGGELLNASLF